MLDNFMQINRRIEIFSIRDGQYYSTVIQDLYEDVFNVLVPYKRGIPLTLIPGEEVQVWVAGENEGYQFSSKIISRTKDKVPLYSLKMPENMTRVQRRTFVRLPVSMEISCAKLPLPGESLEFKNGLVADISAGGAKLIHKENIPVGQKLILCLNLQLKHIMYDIKVMGQVLRAEVTESPYGGNMLGVEFIDMSQSDRDKISKYIFDKQVELKRTGQIGK